MDRSGSVIWFHREVKGNFNILSILLGKLRESLFDSSLKIVGLHGVWEVAIIQKAEKRVEHALMDVELLAVRMLESGWPLVVNLLWEVVLIGSIFSQVEKTVKIDLD